MASLDNLPPDQRAVIQLVLQRGRSYDQIAAMLSIDRAAVRQRALGALDALGPHTQVPSERRALITDYLLGQLPERTAEDARRQLAQSPSDRAWARVVAAELGPVASGRLPEIPVAAADGAQPAAEPEVVQAPAQAIAPRAPAQAVAPRAPAEAEPVTAGPAAAEPEPPRRGAAPPASRRGGALLLGLVALAIVAVVVIVIATSGSSNKSKQAASASSTAASTTSGSTSTGAQILGQINLTAPSGSSKTAGIAEVLRQGTTVGIAIVAQNVPPNQHDAYAVWLYNSPSDAHILGFVNPGVGSNGRLSTTGPLPTNASHFKQLIITRETQSHPRQPGSIILQGQLTGVA